MAHASITNGFYNQCASPHHADGRAMEEVDCVEVSTGTLLPYTVYWVEFRHMVIGHDKEG